MTSRRRGRAQDGRGRACAVVAARRRCPSTIITLSVLQVFFLMAAALFGPSHFLQVLSYFLHARARTRTHARARAHTHTHTHTYTHKRARALTHTHTQLNGIVSWTPTRGLGDREEEQAARPGGKNDSDGVDDSDVGLRWILGGIRCVCVCACVCVCVCVCVCKCV